MSLSWKDTRVFVISYHANGAVLLISYQGARILVQRFGVSNFGAEIKLLVLNVHEGGIYRFGFSLP